MTQGRIKSLIQASLKNLFRVIIGKMPFVLAQIDATLFLAQFFLAQGIPGLIGLSSQCSILMLYSPVIYMFLPRLLCSFQNHVW